MTIICAGKDQPKEFISARIFGEFLERKEHGFKINNEEKMDSVAEDLEELAVLTKHIINGIR